MSDLALEAQGTVLKIGDGGSPTEIFTSIPEIKTFTGPGGSASVIDVTDLLSTAKEKRMGLRDEGQLSFTINYIPDNAQHAQLRADRAARTLRNFQLIFTDAGATQWNFSAYITAFSVSGAVDGTIEGNVTLEISGAITEV